MPKAPKIHLEKAREGTFLEMLIQPRLPGCGQPNVPRDRIVSSHDWDDVPFAKKCLRCVAHEQAVLNRAFSFAGVRL